MSCICPYCNQPAKLVGGGVIYPHRPDLWALKFWQCAPCGAYVGCHKPGARTGLKGGSSGTQPLGRLANAELRSWKSRAHAAFDPLWRDGGMTRGAAYKWLGHKLGLHKNDCHIGLFDVETCKQAVALADAETGRRLQKEMNARFGEWSAA